MELRCERITGAGRQQWNADASWYPVAAAPSREQVLTVFIVIWHPYYPAITHSSPLPQGLVEYLDVNEEGSSLVAMYPQKCWDEENQRPRPEVRARSGACRINSPVPSRRFRNTIMPNQQHNKPSDLAPPVTR